MDQGIVLFPHKDIEAWSSSSSPLSILEGIVTHTSRRNKTIHRNRATGIDFILSENAERTKRINRAAPGLEANLHRRVRYINANECKGKSKNPYQVLPNGMIGGNRP